MNAPEFASRKATVLVAACATVFAAWSLEPEWRAGWQVMDDWTVIAEAGSDQRLSMAELLVAIDTSEAMHPGADARYRPAIKTLHLLELAVLGTRDPGAWFRWRTVQWAFVLATFAWIIVTWSGTLPGFAIAAYAATQYHWRDIWAHLFVSEPWCAVGLAIFALGWHRSRGTRRADASIATAAIGLAIAAGSKENFLLLAPALAWLGWSARRAGRLGAGGVLACGAGLLYSAGIIAAVLWGASNVGYDTYGNSTDLGARLALLATPFPSGVAAATALGVALLLRFRRFAHERFPGAERAVDEIVRGLLVVVATSATLLLSQYAYYAGRWPAFGGRFDFPGRLTDVIVLTGAAWAWRRAESAGLIRSSAAAVGRWTMTFVVAALAMRHAGSLRSAAHDIAEDSHAFHDVIESVASAVVNTPGAPVLLVAGDQDEPVIAFTVFLAQRLPAHPLFVAMAETPGGEDPRHSGAAALRRMEEGWEAKPGEPQPALRPLREYDHARARAGGACVALAIQDYGVPRFRPNCDPP